MFLILVGVWFFFKKKWGLGAMTVIIGCFMWTLSISPVSDAMLKGLESDLKVQEGSQGDVIIMLAGGLGDEGLVRVICAAELQKKLKVPIIVSGGKVFENKELDSPIIKKLLVDLNVPGDKIIIEDKSRDTFENAKYSGEICKKMGYKVPILVTSPWHLKRAMMSFKLTGLPALSFPAQIERRKNKQYAWSDYLPHSFKEASIAFKEYLGLAFYALAY